MSRIRFQQVEGEDASKNTGTILRIIGIRSCIWRERIEETGRTGRGEKSASEEIHLHLL